MPIKKQYEVEASRLAKVIDLAIEAFESFPPASFSKEHIKHFTNAYAEWKASVLNPIPACRNIRSLSYITADAFTFFQESTGEAVEYFWQKINSEGLDFLREDKLRKILERGKIKGLIDYDYVVDLLVAAEQEGRITNEDVVKLNNILGVFETQRRR